MATCKDCLGFEFCLDRLGTTKYYDKAIAANNVEELCRKFKDRKRFIEVVRCKDCKWLNKTKMICMNKNNRVFNTGKTVYSNNFCNYGAKMDKE